MLLRRVTQHVKDQNWFAVFVDLLIVVVGVYIGIQVANWNAERQNQKEQLSYLELLHTELAPRIENYERFFESLEEVGNNERFVVETLRSGKLDNSETTRFNSGLVTIIRVHQPDTSLLVKRLETSDIVDDYQGTKYHEILSRLYSSWTRASRNMKTYVDQAKSARDLVFNRVYMSPSENFVPIPQYNFKQLVNDKAFVHAVAQLYHFNKLSRNTFRRAHNEIVQSVKELEAALYPNGHASLQGK